jgi:hypothetical protein
VVAAAAAADPRCYLDVHQFPLDASTLRTRKTKNPVARLFVFLFVFWDERPIELNFDRER